MEVEGPVVVFSILALAATLVAVVLLYVLVAQIPSIGSDNYDKPSLSFPGQVR